MPAWGSKFSNLNFFIYCEYWSFVQGAGGSFQEVEDYGDLNTEIVWYSDGQKDTRIQGFWKNCFDFSDTVHLKKIFQFTIAPKNHLTFLSEKSGPLTIQDW